MRRPVHLRRDVSALAAALVLGLAACGGEDVSKTVDQGVDGAAGKAKSEADKAKSKAEQAKPSGY